MDPSTQPVAINEFLRENQLFEQVVHQTQTGSWELPNLSSEPPNALANFIKKLFDFISSLFPDVHLDAPHAAKSIGEFISKYGLLTFSLFVVCAAALYLFYFLRKSRHSNATYNKVAPSQVEQTQSLDDQLQRALASHIYPLAARLRWAQFLSRTKLRASTTPLDATAIPALSSLRQNVTNIYLLMFGSMATSHSSIENNAAQLYAHFNKYLTQIEDNPHAQ